MNLLESEDSFLGEVEGGRLSVLNLDRHEEGFFSLGPFDAWELSIMNEK